MYNIKYTIPFIDIDGNSCIVQILEKDGFKVKFSKNLFSNTCGYSATAKEKDSGASRADREAERERLNRERERQAKEAEQRLAKERAERKARSHDRGISR